LSAIQKLLQKVTPKAVWRLLKKQSLRYKRIKFHIIPRRARHGETSKARARRIRENFFEKFCRGKGLDIGYGGDLLAENCLGLDIEDADAHDLGGIEDETFDFVYSSHTLEHLFKPEVALSNWWRVLKPGGYLILYLPDRDLYEKKKTLPSRWSVSHECYFLLDEDDPPDTIGVLGLVERTLSDYAVVYAKTCSEGHTITDPLIPSDGEYSIEVVLQKKA
jgi:SAM-dependent methyltransferase